MQNKNQKNPSKIKNLCSKFKAWCVAHNVPTLLIPSIVLVLVATGAILLGGHLAGWDIATALTSPTAVLIYVIIGAITVGCLGYCLIYNRDRW